MTLHSTTVSVEEKHLSRELIIKRSMHEDVEEVIELKLHVLKLKKNSSGEIVCFETSKFDKEESGVIYHDSRLMLLVEDSGSIKLIEI